MPLGGRVRVNQAEVERLMRGSEMARALGRGGEAGTKEAKRLCPTSPRGSGDNPSGFLRSSLGWKLGQDAKGLHVDIGTDVEYALYVEFGTAPHEIRSHGPYPLRSRDGRVFGRVVHHPGTAAQPYLRPAKDAAVRAIGGR